MKNTILLLTLLFSVNAFAFVNPCDDGDCTIKQIEAYNRANYKTHEQLIQEADAWEAEQERKWTEEHREAQARADAAPKYVYVPGGQYRTCVQEVLEQATGILGDDATKHIDVSIITPGKCSFTVKQFGDLGRGCDNLAALSGIAKIGFYQEEQCRFEAEKWEVYSQYKDVIYTPAWTSSVSREYYEKMKPIELKHLDITKKMNEQEKTSSKTN